MVKCSNRPFSVGRLSVKPGPKRRHVDQPGHFRPFEIRRLTAADADREFQFQSFANSLPGSLFTHLALRVREPINYSKLEFLAKRPRHGLLQRRES